MLNIETLNGYYKDQTIASRSYKSFGHISLVMTTKIEDNEAKVFYKVIGGTFRDIPTFDNLKDAVDAYNSRF